MHKQIFVTMAHPEKTVSDVLVLTASIRKFAGEMAQSPIWIFVNKSLGELKNQEYQQFKAFNARVIYFEADQEASVFTFGKKVQAAALAEELARGKTEFLTWLDSDSIVLNEPVEFTLPPDKILGYRPVHHRLLGPVWGEPLDAFWSLIYKECQVSSEMEFSMVTHAGEKIRPYFNAGTFVVRPEAGLLTQWWQVFQKLYPAPFFKPFYEKDSRYLVFMHQSVFTGVLLNRLKVKGLQELSFKINYPLHLHQEVPPGLRPASIDELITVRHESVISQSGWQKNLPISEPLLNWIEAQIKPRNAAGELS